MYNIIEIAGQPTTIALHEKHYMPSPDWVAVRREHHACETYSLAVEGLGVCFRPATLDELLLKSSHKGDYAEVPLYGYCYFDGERWLVGGYTQSIVETHVDTDRLYSIKMIISGVAMYLSQYSIIKPYRDTRELIITADFWGGTEHAATFPSLERAHSAFKNAPATVKFTMRHAYIVEQESVTVERMVRAYIAVPEVS
jgi:hypothetical protein